MGKFQDLTGKRFGKLTVLYRVADHVQPSGQRQCVWHCRCDCGNECDVRAIALTQGEKTHCGCVPRGNRKTTDVFIKELQAINPNIEVLDTYSNARTPIKVKCTVCGHEWKPLPNGLLHRNGCPYCSRVSRRKSDTEFKAQVKEINPNIKILGTYIGVLTPIHASCSTCGYVWEAVPNHLLRGCGCPECARGVCMKKVMCVESGMIYGSITKASEVTNISGSSISSCCRGRRKTAGGFHWKFVD